MFMLWLKFCGYKFEKKKKSISGQSQVDQFAPVIISNLYFDPNNLDIWLAVNATRGYTLCKIGILSDCHENHQRPLLARGRKISIFTFIFYPHKLPKRRLFFSSKFSSGQ